MTSTAPQQTPSQATTSSANASVPSYASAAGAAKKQSSAPVVAPGSSQPVVAAGSSVPTPQHAKSSSISPMNGRPNIMPAVPTVAHGTSSVNGESHKRTPSVTISNGPSYSNGSAAAPKSGIQFGFESPAVSHSSPAPVSAPIAIPGSQSNPRATSPANSPSPIPLPSASGGRPPSSAQQGASMTFGSFNGDGDRPHMRTPSMSQDPNSLGSHPSPHMRRNSSHSHADMNNQSVPQGGMGRGNYGAGRGRGGYNNNFNNHHNTGYPPNPNNYRGPPSQGRGGVPGPFPNNRQQQFGTPPPQHRSPALAPAMPHQPQPHMAQGMNAAPFYFQPPPMGPTPQVTSPSLPFSTHASQHLKYGKKKGGSRRDNEKYSGHFYQTDSFKDGQDYNRHRRYSRRYDHPRNGVERGPFLPDKADMSRVSDQPPLIPQLQPPFTALQPLPHRLGPTIDLSPESGNFDRLLTNAKQNYYPGHYDPNMRQAMPMQGYPQYPMMHGQGQSPAPSYQMPYVPGPYNPPGGQPMSRTSSQISDHRPTSSASQQTAPPTIPQGTPQPHPSTVKPTVVQSPQFTRPVKKSCAISIKNENGETLDLSRFKAPASPALTSQHSKTPPIVSSTPTPPPKPSTPSAPTHSRSESATTKTAEEIKNEFKEKMKQAASAEKAKEEEAAAAAKAAEEEKAQAAKAKEEEEAKAQAEAELKKQEEAKAAEEAKAKQEAEEKAEADAKLAEQTSKEEASKADDEDDIERIIREMEEADAKREKEEAEREAKRQAEKELKKKAEEESRKANAAENDRKLREAEAEMERLENEKEARRIKEREGSEEKAAASVADTLARQKVSGKDAAASTAEATTKLANLSLGDKSTAASSVKPGPSGRGPKPAALNLAPLKTSSVEPPQPSAALQSLKTARLLDVIKTDIYPPGINSPNPALNAAVAKKGTSFKYDPGFLLQFKGVFTEQPSLDFHQQVKTLIGDGDGGSRSSSVRTPAGGSGRQNSRGGAGAGAFVMGSFGAPGGRTLPPGTTSEQRMAMSTGNIPRPPMNPMGSFPGPRSGFPGGASMSRTSSSANMSNIPNSPRQGSRRNASKQQSGFNPKAEAQQAKTMPLTHGARVEALTVSQTGWKPTSIGKPAAATVTPDGHLDPQLVQRKVKAALNKMTPENFDKISDQILTIAGQSKDESDGRTLRQVIQLTFEKATDEAHWASMYAKFCKRMLEMMSPEIRDENIRDRTGTVVSGGALFRKYLLNRCQEEFERGWKPALPEPKEGEKEDKKTLEAAMLSDEYYIAAAAKRRGLGLVQFIGELYKLGMLTERIMHECVKKLVDYQGTPDEAEVESLSKLLRTIGGNLDATEKGKLMMDAYFQRIESMMNIPDLNSRLKFMLLDVIDLRKARWHSKEANKGPKTLEEVRAEAEAAAAQKAAEAARGNQRGGPGGRMATGRGDARGYGGFPQAAPNQIGIEDLRRLKGGANRASSSNVTLGPTSMFGSRSNSGRRLGPGGSLSRGAEDSGASSRTGTPPVKESSTNAFSLLANMGESEHPASPPSTAASPALSKAVPDTSRRGN